jgi:hypothetical protein
MFGKLLIDGSTAGHGMPWPYKCEDLSISFAFAGDLRRVCERPGLIGQFHAAVLY